LIEYLIGGAVASAIAFAAVYASTPSLIRYLTKRSSTVLDYHRREKTMVASPGGPVIIVGILAAEAALYGLFQNPGILAIMVSSSLAFLVGWIDDMRTMGGWFKPLALAGAAVPIILLGAYDTNLTFPLFGDVQIPLLYLGLIVVMIPITGNTINSIDVFNGVASGFMVIAGLSLTVAIFIVESFSATPNYEIALASLPLVFVALAFYRYHRLPSKIFPGDSGALALGAMYGALAIVGQVEVIAAVALLPAVVNSFLFLASVRRIVEHRELRARPVAMTDDFKLRATDDLRAPITLVRIILSNGPMTEKQVAFVIFRLAIFAGALAVVTALMTGVRM